MDTLWMGEQGPHCSLGFTNTLSLLFQVQTAECRVGGARGGLQQENCVLEQSHEQGAGEVENKNKALFKNHKSEYYFSSSRKEREEPGGRLRNCFGSFQC